MSGMARRRTARAALGVLCLACVGCSTYVGSASDFDPGAMDREPGWVRVDGVPLVMQEGGKDCGAAALSMVLAFWKEPVPAADISRECQADPGSGIRAGELRDLARRKGFKAFLFDGVIADLRRELSLGRPVLVGMVKPLRSGAVTHFEVVVGVHLERELVVTLDPARGWRRNDFRGFRQEWEPAQGLTLVVFR